MKLAVVTLLLALALVASPVAAGIKPGSCPKRLIIIRPYTRYFPHCHHDYQCHGIRKCCFGFCMIPCLPTCRPWEICTIINFKTYWKRPSFWILKCLPRIKG